jgi:hypothetical protein
MHTKPFFTDGVHLGARIESQWGERFTSEDYFTMYQAIDHRIEDQQIEYQNAPLDGGLVLETSYESDEVDCDGVAPARVYVIVREADCMNADGTENHDKMMICSVRLGRS